MHSVGRAESAKPRALNPISTIGERFELIVLIRLLI
jgi:hypothetical protein